MQKIFALLAACLFLATSAANATEGTEAYFLSPHGLGKSPEVSLALQKITPQIKIARTQYNHSSTTYVLSNMTIGSAYNDGRQNITILAQETVQVSGGRVQFTYKFNYSKTQNKTVVNGYGYGSSLDNIGSVLSDPLVYRKQLTFGSQGFLNWQLKPKGFSNLSLIQNRMKIKRLEPFTQSDLQNLEDMLDKVFQSITPSNIQIQILDTFNNIFPLALNDSLNHQIFGETINYTYHSETHGQMKMNVIHKMFNFDVQPEDGYKVIFVTEIENWAQPICNATVPYSHLSFSQFGGSHNIHLNCVYESVISYMQSNGWLDTKLGEAWETNSLQFYAGDLFDMINNLYLSANPRAMLEGSCAASQDQLRFFPSREYDSNSYQLGVTYNCNMKTTSIQGATLPVLKFSAKAKFYIKAATGQKSLTFQILYADIASLSFEPVGNFYVTNTPLALFKANQMLKLLQNHYVFGTGFPSIPRQTPKTKVMDDYVVYYDYSHFEGALAL